MKLAVLAVLCAMGAAPPTAARLCVVGTPAPLTIVREAVAKERLGLRIAPSKAAPEGSRFPANSLTLLAVDRLAGPCADQVRSTKFGLYDLANGLQVQRTGDTVRMMKAELAAPLPRPEWSGARFVASREIGFGPALKAVGIWQIGREWVVAAYLVGTADARRELLRSQLPLVGLGYTPSPDSPSGDLNLIQRAPEGVRVVRLNWWHPHAVY